MDEARVLARRIGEVELLDRSYQIAAMTFVALIPLVLAISAVVVGGQEALGRMMIERFGLVGFAAEVVSDMMRTSKGEVYWLGLVLTFYSAFSLSRKVSRAYNRIWGTPQLRVTDHWRGLVWVALQVLTSVAVIQTRELLTGDQGLSLTVVAITGNLMVWWAADFASQWLLTRAAVARRRLLIASAITAVGRLGVAVWAIGYLSMSMSRQAEQFGALGVVFSLFTYFLASSIVMLSCTLVVAVLTEDPAQRQTR